MEMTPATRTMIRFMSGPWGRSLRIAGGIALWALALVEGGWALLLGIPGSLMLITGVMNYCPAGLMLATPRGQDEQGSRFIASLQPTNLLKR